VLRRKGREAWFGWSWRWWVLRVYAGFVCSALRTVLVYIRVLFSGSGHCLYQ